MASTQKGVILVIILAITLTESVPLWLLGSNPYTGSFGQYNMLTPSISQQQLVQLYKLISLGGNTGKTGAGVSGVGRGGGISVGGPVGGGGGVGGSDVGRGGGVGGGSVVGGGGKVGGCGKVGGGYGGGFGGGFGGGGFGGGFGGIGGGIGRWISNYQKMRLFDADIPDAINPTDVLDIDLPY